METKKLRKREREKKMVLIAKKKAKVVKKAKSKKRGVEYECQNLHTFLKHLLSPILIIFLVSSPNNSSILTSN